jgi:hypothetical protein
VAFADFSADRIELRNTKRTRTHTEFTANTSILINYYRPFFVFGNGFNWACFCTRWHFAMHASPVEETPFCLLSGFVMLKFEFDMGIGVVGKLWRISPFITKGSFFAGIIVPSFASYLAGSTANAFGGVN